MILDKGTIASCKITYEEDEYYVLFEGFKTSRTYYLRVYTVSPSPPRVKALNNIDEKILSFKLLSNLDQNSFQIAYTKFKHLIPDDVLDSDEFIKLVINNI